MVLPSVRSGSCATASVGGPSGLRNHQYASAAPAIRASIPKKIHRAADGLIPAFGPGDSSVDDTRSPSNAGHGDGQGRGAIATDAPPRTRCGQDPRWGYPKGPIGKHRNMNRDDDKPLNARCDPRAAPSKG